MGAGGEQDHADVAVEQVEHDLDFLDHRVVATRVEEPAPVAARRFDVVLTGRSVGEDTVDVDEHGTTGLDRAVAPGPVFGGNTSS